MRPHSLKFVHGRGKLGEKFYPSVKQLFLHGRAKLGEKFHVYRLSRPAQFVSFYNYAYLVNIFVKLHHICIG